MKAILFSSLMMILPALAMAQATDLVLPGAKWQGTATGYVCKDDGVAVNAPAALADMDLAFETVTTDQSLDNALLTATFSENGMSCRYNAIIFADNAGKTTTLIQSIAYNTAGGATAYRDCLQGKEILDAALEHNDYLYYGRPHNLAIMMPIAGAESVCESGLVGANFVVSGRLDK